MIFPSSKLSQLAVKAVHPVLPFFQSLWSGHLLNILVGSPTSLSLRLSISPPPYSTNTFFLFLNPPLCKSKLDKTTALNLSLAVVGVHTHTCGSVKILRRGQPAFLARGDAYTGCRDKDHTLSLWGHSNVTSAPAQSDFQLSGHFNIPATHFIVNSGSVCGRGCWKCCITHQPAGVLWCSGGRLSS